MITKKVLCIVAGSSGGHLIPGITEAFTALKNDPEQRVLFFSTGSELDRALLKEYGTTFTLCTLPLIPVPGKRAWLYPLFFFRMIQSFLKSFFLLRSSRPYQVLSMGGLISVPVCLAARLLGCKVVLFELNAVPGKAVTFLAPLVKRVRVCFNEAGASFDAKKVLFCPYPLRFSVEDKLISADARTQLDLDRSKKTIAIVGGSQGSHAINNLILAMMNAYPQLHKEVQFIHQTGAYKMGEIDAHRMFKQLYQEKGIQSVVFDFTHNLNVCYSAADLVIARAGAGTLFELEFFNKKTLLIPLENAAQGHQLDNALAMIKQNPELFFLLRQEHAQKSPAHLYDQIVRILELPGN